MLIQREAEDAKLDQARKEQIALEQGARRHVENRIRRENMIKKTNRLSIQRYAEAMR